MKREVLFDLEIYEFSYATSVTEKYSQGWNKIR